MTALLTEQINWFVYAKSKATGQHETAGPFTAAYLALDHIDKHYPEDLWSVIIRGKQQKVSV